MLPSYQDIISRLGTPLWYDPAGVPRYDIFTPGMCSVYARIVALLQIKCQACERSFIVASQYEMDDLTKLPAREAFPSDNEFREALGEFLHYGDPPRHAGKECAAGDTMNSIPLKILELHTKGESGGTESHFSFLRRTDLEGLEIIPEWGKDDQLSRT